MPQHGRHQETSVGDLDGKQDLCFPEWKGCSGRERFGLGHHCPLHHHVDIHVSCKHSSADSRQSGLLTHCPFHPHALPISEETESFQSKLASSLCPLPTLATVGQFWKHHEAREGPVLEVFNAQAEMGPPETGSQAIWQHKSSRSEVSVTPLTLALNGSRQSPAAADQGPPCLVSLASGVRAHRFLHVLMGQTQQCIRLDT